MVNIKITGKIKGNSEGARTTIYKLFISELQVLTLKYGLRIEDYPRVFEDD